MVIKPTNVSTRNIVTYTKIKLLNPNDWPVIFYLPCDKKETTNLTRKYPKCNIIIVFTYTRLVTKMYLHWLQHRKHSPHNDLKPHRIHSCLQETYLYIHLH
ncbi:hypothetical protein Hanom_Chr10g00892301 [Helianthus anomalus]